MTNSDWVADTVLASKERQMKPAILETKSPCFRFPTILTTFINFGFYLLFIPFRLETNRTTNQVTIKRISLQKLFCLLIHIVAALKSILDLSKLLRENLESNPGVVFELMSYFAHTVAQISFSVFCWSIKRKIESVLNNVATFATPRRKRINFISFTWIGLQFLIYTATFFIDNPIIIPSQWTSEIGRFRYLLHESDVNVPYEGEISPLLITSVSFVLISFYISAIQFMFNYLWMTLAAYSIYEVAKDLQSRGKDAECNGIVLKDTEDAMQKIRNINRATEVLFLTGFLSTFFMLPRYLFQVMNSEIHYVSRIIRLFYILNRLVPYWIAAAGFHQVSKFRDSLSIKLLRDLTSQEEQYLNRLLEFLKLNINHFGVKGGNFFTVTFSFLGMTLSILLTYVLVLIQLRIPVPDPKV